MPISERRYSLREDTISMFFNQVYKYIESDPLVGRFGGSVAGKNIATGTQCLAMRPIRRLARA